MAVNETDKRAASLSSLLDQQRQINSALVEDNRALSRLLGALQSMVVARSVAEVADIAMRTAVEVGAADRCAMVVDNGDAIHVHEYHGSSGAASGANLPSIADAARNEDRPVARGNLVGGEGIEESMGAAAGIPFASNKPHGARGSLAVYWRDRTAPTRSQIDLLTALAEMVPVALESVEVTSDLEQMVARRTRQLGLAKDAAEAANRAKTAFLASMSHELRTPLNAVLGYAQILSRDPTLSAPQSAHVSLMQRSAEHLLTLISDLLDLAKIEAERLEIEFGVFELEPFIRDMVELFRNSASNKGVAFSYVPSPPLPKHVNGDETRLRQVLLNVLGNAVKFTSGGTVEFEVRHGRDELTVVVSDSGCGMTPSELALAFEPFRQVGDRRFHTAGTGLGLSIVKRLIDAMHGGIAVTSEHGEGTSVSIRVPLPAAKPPRWVRPVGIRAGVVGYHGPRKRVLVVDDEPANRAVIRDMLEPLGFDLVEAADGREALTVAATVRPDVGIVDLVMPELDGFGVIAEMSTHPTLRGLPLVASSATVSGEKRRQSTEAGFREFLAKPVRLDRLLVVLEEALELQWSWDVEDAPESALKQLKPLPEEVSAALVEHCLCGDVAALSAVVGTLADGDHDDWMPILRGLMGQFDLERIRSLVEQKRG